jgi:hypothetical protein
MVRIFIDLTYPVVMNMVKIFRIHNGSSLSELPVCYGGTSVIKGKRLKDHNLNLYLNEQRNDNYQR